MVARCLGMFPFGFHFLSLIKHFLVHIFFVARFTPWFHYTFWQQLKFTLGLLLLLLLLLGNIQSIILGLHAQIVCILMMILMTIKWKLYLLNCPTLGIKDRRLLKDRYSSFYIAFCFQNLNHKTKDVRLVKLYIQKRRSMNTYLSFTEERFHIFWLTSQHIIDRLQCNIKSGNFHLSSG